MIENQTMKNMKLALEIPVCIYYTVFRYLIDTEYLFNRYDIYKKGVVEHENSCVCFRKRWRWKDTFIR